MNDDQNKRTGDFIRSLRESLKQSQQEFADMLFVERSTVSKWENGSSFPKNESLILICEKFDLTIDELLAGERSNSKNRITRNNIILSILNKERKLKVLNKYFMTLLFIVTFLFLTYYFFTTYNSIHVYLVYGSGTDYKINDGLLIMSNEKVYFKTGKILDKNNKLVSINKIELYSINNDDKKLLFIGEPDELLVQKSDNIEIFENFKKKNFFNNIYINIKSNNNEELIKVTVKKDFNNKSLFLNLKKTANSKTINNEYYKINKDFIYNDYDNTYTLKKQNLEIVYFENSKELRIIVKNKINKIYEYNMIIGDLKYVTYENNEIINKESINLKQVNSNEKTIFKDFKINYLDKYFSETIDVN